MLRKLMQAGALVALFFSCAAAAGGRTPVAARFVSQVERPLASLKSKGTRMSLRQAGRVRAPELTGGRGWLNTDKPLSLAALRGKVVLLDFWTYGCINCMHIIPDLQRLEEKYARQLVVIGVHSAKFENEKETENIRRVILRYGIEHPVVNDADFAIWQAYAVRAWPTQVLIDPEGYVVGVATGEGNYEVIDRAIAQAISEARARGRLNEQPLKLALERAKVGELPLAFPGKVVADERADRLFIADSNHNRIVVTRLDGELLFTIGTGERGHRDGPLDQATFQRPQGMALDGDTLYVADTANHLLRRVDLKTRSVETIAGTGEQLRDYRLREGEARTTPLSSPWDLQLVGRTLYIAMAGPHQIWKLDLETRRLAVFAGTGREAREDGPRIGTSLPDGTPTGAAFAQPSGLTTDGRTLYVADSESNIIRAVALDDATHAADGVSPASLSSSSVTSRSPSSDTSREQVRTLAGGDLFEFGDREGRGDEARFQHPLGVVAEAGMVFVADTYNHKIKRLDPQTRTVKTFVGTGRPGQTDGPRPSFYEPGGLAVARGHLYVADTNNHAIRVIDLKTGQTSTLMLRGLRPPETKQAASADAADLQPNAEEQTLAPQRLRAGAPASLNVNVTLPAGFHLNPSAPQRYRVSLEKGDAHLALDAEGPNASNGNAATLREAATTPHATATPPRAAAAPASKVLARTSKDLRLPLSLPLRPLSPGGAELRVQLNLFYCREDNTGTCQIKTLIWRAPVEVTADASAPAEVKVQGKVE